MEITFYTPATIRDLVSSERFPLLKYIPVTSQRAVSHSRNPRAHADDKILFVAWEKNEIAGYLGVLPDFIYENNLKIRTGWLSCFWVAPDSRGTDLSKQLISLVMEAWDNHILITNMAPGTIPFYLKTGLFNPPVYKEGFRGYLQFNFSEILPPKKEIFRKSIPLLKVADFLLNMVNGVRLLFYRGYGFSGNFRIDYQDGISREAAGFIPDQYQDEYCRRGKEELEWILQDPWLAEEDIHHHRESRYYFSSVVKRFVRQVVEFSSGDGTLSAFLILNIRDNHLTVPYFYGKEEALRDVVNFLFNTMLDYQLNMLTIFNGSLVKQLWKSSSPFAFRRKIIRPYVFPKSLNIQLPAFQDGDGDSVFT